MPVGGGAGRPVKVTHFFLLGEVRGGVTRASACGWREGIRRDRGENREEEGRCSDGRLSGWVLTVVKGRALPSKRRGLDGVKKPVKISVHLESPKISKTIVEPNVASSNRRALRRLLLGRLPKIFSIEFNGTGRCLKLPSLYLTSDT